MSTRVTMSDVARQAGVSLMTVSRVINNKGDVSSETRQRVLEIISNLGYRPSAIARSLATKETSTIGLVIPDVSNAFFAEITQGVERLAYSKGYHVFLCNTEEDPQRELAVIQSLEEKRVDGLILCSSRLDEEKLIDILANLPAVVLINRRVHQTVEDTFDSVTLDDERGGWLAAHHLIKSGHRQIGFLAGPPASYSGAGRRKGFLAALQEAGVNWLDGWMKHCQPSVEGGYEATRYLLGTYPQLTALFCFNDLVAVGALQACDELDRRVPQDLAIVGHDDIPVAALVSPTLTTCRVPRYELGARAVNALLERLHDCPGECSQIVLQPELVIRESAP
ncbi:MAG TPA: LacI family DNA-binding transcriptional regulator [Anaerolineales bacterium]|nr:LacI family DNA-binding transcriptional regulator [Anaerolineales bacterium]